MSNPFLMTQLTGARGIDPNGGADDDGSASGESGLSMLFGAMGAFAEGAAKRQNRQRGQSARSASTRRQSAAPAMQRPATMGIPTAAPTPRVLGPVASNRGRQTASDLMASIQASQPDRGLAAALGSIVQQAQTASQQQSVTTSPSAIGLSMHADAKPKGAFRPRESFLALASPVPRSYRSNTARRMGSIGAEDADDDDPATAFGSDGDDPDGNDDDDDDGGSNVRQGQSVQPGGRTTHPFVRRYRGTFLTDNVPYHATTVRGPGLDEPRHATDGMVRATIATMPIHRLRSAIAYALEHASLDGTRPTMLAHPENFERFEEVRDDQALRHEVLKEPSDVLWDLYQIAGRVNSTGKPADSIDGGGGGGAKELVGYERAERTIDPKAPGMRVPHFVAVDPSNPVPLMANVGGGPHNDDVVYVREPAMEVQGLHVGNPANLHPVCDEFMDQWSALMADLPNRSGDATYGRYMPQRDGIAQVRGASCPVGSHTVGEILARRQRGESAAAPGQLSEASRDILYRGGLTDAQIASVWQMAPSGASAADLA